MCPASLRPRRKRAVRPFNRAVPELPLDPRPRPHSAYRHGSTGGSRLGQDGQDLPERFSYTTEERNGLIDRRI
jgi:hypothetical protein